MSHAVEWVTNVLHAAPEIAIALAVGIGYLLGLLRFGPFTLGATAGGLIVGILIGVMVPGIEISPLLKTIFFSLFIYAVGFKTGPQFFNGLNRGMISQVVLTVVLCVSGLIAVVIAARILNLDKGTAAGLGAGALTQSAVIGTAGDALSRLDLAPEELKRQTGNIAIGYAVTYILGTILVIFFVRDIAPRFLGIKIRDAARQLEIKLSGGSSGLGPGQVRMYQARGVRAYRAEAGRGAGQSIRALEEKAGGRCVIAGVHRAGEAQPIAPGTMLQAGDQVLVGGRVEGLLNCEEVIGPETTAEEFDVVLQTVDAVVTRREVIGKTMAELAQGGHGVFLTRLLRGGVDMPVSPETVVQRGDLLKLIGLPDAIAAVAATLGYAEKPSDKMDLLYLGLGITIGTLIGMVSVKVFHVPVTLGSGGGVLIAGLLFGWLRALHPTFGRFPGAVQTAFSDLGLNAFIAIVGISAGPRAIDALKETGLGLLVAGIAVTLVPQILGLIAGRLMRMEPIVLLGALAGAQTANAAITALTDQAESDTPNLGFTVPYAIGNVLLTVWGPIIVGLV